MTSSQIAKYTTVCSTTCSDYHQMINQRSSQLGLCEGYQLINGAPKGHECRQCFHIIKSWTEITLFTNPCYLPSKIRSITLGKKKMTSNFGMVLCALMWRSMKVNGLISPVADVLLKKSSTLITKIPSKPYITGHWCWGCTDNHWNPHSSAQPCDKCSISMVSSSCDFCYSETCL